MHIKFWLGNEGKKPCRKPGHIWEDNMTMDLWETECGLDASGSG
jgi:hypothetical protein